MACLDLIGLVSVSDAMKAELMAHAEADGFGNGNESSTARINELMQLIVSTREYQMA